MAASCAVVNLLNWSVPKAAICEVIKEYTCDTDKLDTVDVLKLAILCVLIATTCAVVMTASWALVKADISADDVAAISAVDQLFTVVVLALDTPEIAVAMICPWLGTFQAVRPYRQQI
jgi:hypothetical protein